MQATVRVKPGARFNRRESGQLKTYVAGATLTVSQHVAEKFADKLEVLGAGVAVDPAPAAAVEASADPAGGARAPAETASAAVAADARPDLMAPGPGEPESGSATGETGEAAGETNGASGETEAAPAETAAPKRKPGRPRKARAAAAGGDAVHDVGGA